ncbi:cyclopropane-fatty-acyl-phospholipid synthase family protein [Synechococcus sp. PCC 7336]|uniref:SAM-dependent methyltransferase n=1 Tax=Synechococcus sp. PCC 7336 TaxID=195250 RepID=UPI00034A9BC0|nr:class I SAM-dependent methyltransferase [Synechococcus sp. PCC 7336]
MPAKGFRPQPRKPTRLAPYVRTMPVVISAMLDLARVTAEDVVYDLGCGDGRIVLAAARQYGAAGVGVDIDRDCIRIARDRARELGLGDRVQFLQQDLMALDLSPATVVTLYLLPRSNLALRDKLRAELQAGTRILSHSFDMGNWEPEATASAADAINTYPIYLWRV